MGDLFDTPHARNTDPQTSHDAAASVKRIRENQQLILACIKRLGPVTDEQLVKKLSFYTPMSPSGIRTRRNELVKQGLVRDSGHREKLASGRLAILWTA